MIFRSARLRNVRESFMKVIQDKYERDEADNLFRIIAEEFLGLHPPEIILSADRVLSSEELAIMEEAIEQLLNDFPVQYITRSTYFYGAKLKIHPGVLIPRPETEELVDWIVKEYEIMTRADHMLDMGTGTGCIAVSLKKNFPEANVTAVDQFSEALENADTNARLLDVDLELARMDILDRMQWSKLGMFHLIVSNPPYVRESEKSRMKANVLEHEPPGALFIPDDDPLKFYDKILMFSRNHLIRKGWAYFEINEAFGREIIKLMKDYGYSEIELRQDMKGKDRMVRGRLK